MSDALDRVSRQTAPTAAEEDSDRGDGILFFPVRHHSPAAARLAAEAVRELRPDAVLIEGPSDFNQRIDELALDHSPPIAVYSWVVTGDGERRGAYYPFCVYSPEWQALRAGFETGAEVAFIDLPWAELAAERDATLHRYADAELKRSRYVDVLCRNLEGLGQLRKPQQAVDGLRLLLEAHERCGVELDLDREGLVDVLARVVDPEGRKRNTGDGGQQPAVRGAALGALWTLGAAGGERLEDELSLFARPDELGDFLAGLFALAREAVQRRRQLVARIDDLVLGFDDREFLHALPALRLAFSRFTPREKHQLIAALLSGTNAAGTATAGDAAEIERPRAALDAAARLIALEDELGRRLERYRLRGSRRPVK